MKVTIEERARRYVAKMDPSVSGHGGHNACFAAACALVQGFDLPDSVALSILQTDFNPRCSPNPWSERELNHKIRQARLHASGKQAGYLIGDPSNYTRRGDQTSSRPVAKDERVKKRQDFDPAALKRAQVRGFSPDERWLAERSPIDPAGITSTMFLDTIFEPGEKALVFTAFRSQGQYGHVAGAPGVTYGLTDRKMAKATKGAVIPDSAKEGAWFLANPIDGQWYPTGAVDKAGQPILSRRSGRSVTSWRYMVLESDDADEAEWLNLLCQLPLPITAIYTSGGRSVHAMVRIEVKSKSDFDLFRDRITPLLSKLGADPATISGVRLTRLPGVLREGTMTKDGRYFRYDEPRMQQLLYLNPAPTIEPLRTFPKLRHIP